MRVIAGAAKGTRLAPVPNGVRPLSDRAREGLFSSLGDAVMEARALDLYAGTGALGIEALSRGAERAAFVDADRVAGRTIRENLERTRLAGAAEIAVRPALSYLRTEPEAPFDLCFLDPPYATAVLEIETALAALAGGGWLAHGFTVTLTRPARSSKHVIPVDWHVARRLEYGDSLVILYREV